MNARQLVSPPARGLIVIVAATTALLAGCSDTDGQSAADGTPEGSDDTTSEEVDDGDGELTFDGPESGALINADQLADLAFTASGEPGGLDDLRVLLDGEDVTTAADRADGTLTYTPDTLEDGERTVVVADGSSVADDDATAEPEHLHTWSFEVKAEPPTIELSSPQGPILADTSVTVSGNTEPDATVAVGGTTTTAEQDGSFEVDLDGVDGDLTILVTDVAGNTTELTESFAVVASRVEVDEVRTVHATFWAWATPSLREPIIEMIDDGRINAVQLDLKDEGGQIGYPSEVPLAQEIGADIGPLDLEQAVADLHDRDVAVIGRIVAFADPTLASWAWENGRRDMVIQDNDGNDFYRGSYAGFSNYTHEDVIAYNLDLAEEAARAGVDQILWDYIRRPEGTDNYTVPGLTTTPEEAIAEFTRLADERLAPYGIQHGASVYGIAADRPQQIGQDIPAMAQHLDYVAPMLYPSHWGPGEYGVNDPNRQPYDIIRATLEVWDEATEGSRARIVPWFEDTPYRAWDRPLQIREQIRAARDHGIDEWLMWNPGSTFTPAAYERRE